jgi:hypothetical protein
MEIQGLSAHRVNKTKRRSMERLALKGEAIEKRAVGRAGSTINRVSHQRMIDRCHVHTNLVGTAGLKATLNKGCVSERLSQRPVGNGVLPAPFCHNRNLFAILR